MQIPRHWAHASGSADDPGGKRFALRVWGWSQAGAETLERMRAACGRSPRTSFRIYRTSAGFRVLATDLLLDPQSPQAQEPLAGRRRGSGLLGVDDRRLRSHRHRLLGGGDLEQEGKRDTGAGVYSHFAVDGAEPRKRHAETVAAGIEADQAELALSAAGRGARGDALARKADARAGHGDVLFVVHGTVDVAGGMRPGRGRERQQQGQERHKSPCHEPCSDRMELVSVVGLDHREG